jgi:hypothetical protein
MVKSSDFIIFYKDDSYSECWGAAKYTGQGSEKSYCGHGMLPPLEIPANKFIIHFHADAAAPIWGYRIHVKVNRSNTAKHRFIKNISKILSELTLAYPNPETDVAGTLLHRIIRENISIDFIRVFLKTLNSWTMQEVCKWQDEKLDQVALHVACSKYPISDEKTDTRQLNGDELIKEKIRLIGIFTKDSGEQILDNVPVSLCVDTGIYGKPLFTCANESIFEKPSTCMIKIIRRNNLYQELIDKRNLRFWYSIIFILKLK